MFTSVYSNFLVPGTLLGTGHIGVNKMIGSPASVEKVSKAS